jgi:thioredoxin 1
MNCPSCGTPNQDNNRFCTSCGKTLHNAAKTGLSPAIIGGTIAAILVVVTIAAIIVAGAWFFISEESSGDAEKTAGSTQGTVLQSVTDANFNTLVLASQKPVVVDCFAYWCGPCRMIAPVLEDLNSSMSDRVTFLKADVDQVQFVADYDVQSIPTLLLFKNGKVVHKLIGLQTRDDITKAIETHLLQP